MSFTPTARRGQGRGGLTPRVSYLPRVEPSGTTHNPHGKEVEQEDRREGSLFRAPYSPYYIAYI